MNHAPRVKIFIGSVALAAISAAAYTGWHSYSLRLYLAAAILALAAATSRMKVKLPGINGNMSVNLPFLLTAVVNLSAAEALAIAGLSTVVQCWPRKNGKFRPQQMAFNVSMMVLATSLASLIFHAHWPSRLGWASNPTNLLLATLTLFLGQTVLVALVIALSENKSAASLWWEVAHLSFPYYVVSAGVTALVQAVSAHLSWELALGVFPVMYGIHRSYRLCFGRIAESSPAFARAAGAGA